jgi:hypothetical protein
MPHLPGQQHRRGQPYRPVDYATTWRSALTNTPPEPENTKPPENTQWQDAPTAVLPPLRPRPTTPPLPRTGDLDDLPPAVLGGLAFASAAGVIALIVWGAPKAWHWLRAQDWHQLTQWAATIDHPVHAYLAAHTTGLPITAASVYGIWQAIGAAALLIAWWRHTVSARLTWALHGAATAWMVWAAAPATGRAVALGLTVLAWALTSGVVLRGLSPRPLVIVRDRVGA